MKVLDELKVPLLITVLGLVVLPVYAPQPPVALSVHVDEVDVSSFPEVALTLTVRDANGVPVPDLDAEAFEVNEDRRPAALPIGEVAPFVNQDQPVGVVLVVDTSGSMTGQPLEDAKQAVRALVDKLGPQDDVAFIAFADAVDLDGVDPAREQPPTVNHATVLALLDDLEAEGRTPLYDAMFKGVRWAQETVPGHRAVILYTDGVDEGPGSAVASAETPIQAATRAGVPIFTIALGDEIDRGYLERVARVTGGIYQETPDSAQLAELFVNVMDLLKQQYTLTYTSRLPGDGELHRVQVHVEVDRHTASDEAELGPLPLLKEPTSTPAPTDTPAPTAAPTATATPSPAAPASPSFFRRVWNGITSAVGSAWGWVARNWLWLLVVLAVLLLAVALVLILGRAARRRDTYGIEAGQEFCAQCGRPLAPDEVCLSCGPNAGRTA